MIITYQGIEFFKVQFGDTILAFNPISKDSKFKPSRFGADIVLVSAYHPDFNGSDQMGYGDREPFVVSGPGEYEVKGVTIRGFASKTSYGGKELINTIYLLQLENMNLCFLGAHGDSAIPPDLAESIEDIDILFVPIGGDGVLSASEAYKLAVKMEPKLIIPMHWGDIGEKNALNIFLKEGGAEGQKPEDKLTIKKKDLEGKENEVVVLGPQAV